MDYVKIRVQEAAKAFEQSGREARTSQAQRAVREIAKGGLGQALALNAFATCGKLMNSALDDLVDFSPTTQSVYASGDGEHACRMAATTAGDLAMTAMITKRMAEALSADGDARAADVFERYAEKERAAASSAIVEAIVHGARDVIAQRAEDAALKAA